MKSIKIALFLTLCSLTNAVWAQPARDWDMTIGSTGWDEMRLLVPLNDDAYLFGGGVSGSGGNTSITHYGYYEGYVEVRNKSKEKLWSATFGGTEDDKFHSALVLSDGNYLLGGYSASPPSGSKTSNNYGKKDFWIVKVNASGQKLWERTYGGTEDDEIHAMTVLDNGHFLLIGTSLSGADGVKTTLSLGDADIWMVEVTTTGDIVSQQVLGGTKNDNLYEIVPTDDGGFMLGGGTKSEISPTISQSGRGGTDYWVVKLDASGVYQWDKRYGGLGDDQMYDIIPTKDDGFILTGGSTSAASGDKTEINYGSYDIWIVKIDNNGSLLWQKNYGGNGLDVSYAAAEANTGHLYIGGVSDSPVGPGKASNTIGSYDYWILYLDDNGQKLWDKSYGGANSDALTKMELNQNGSLLLAGNSISNSSVFKSENAFGFNDFWLFRTYCGVSLELESEKPNYCEGAEAILQANAQNCAGGLCDISWNNGEGTGDEWSVIADGQQVITAQVRDKSGCTATATTSLQITTPPQVFVGNDTTLRSGSTLVVSTLVTPFTNNLQYLWANGETNSTIIIKESGTYTVSVTNDAGCVATDSINVCLCLGNNVYIPNVFQPDADLYNDTWYILGNDKSVEKIRSVQVIDNWGTIIFDKKDIDINDKNQGWNGTHNNQILPPGVFVYSVEVLYLDGKSEVIFGTVTLIR